MSYSFEVIRQILDPEITLTDATGVKFTWALAKKMTVKDVKFVLTEAMGTPGINGQISLDYNTSEKLVITPADSAPIGTEVSADSSPVFTEFDAAIGGKLEFKIKTQQTAATAGKGRVVLYYQELP